MSGASQARPEEVVMSSESMEDALRQMAREIVETHGDTPFALLGILRRGRPIADRLAGFVESMTGSRPPVGSIATTLYRDDIRSRGGSVGSGKGHTHFDFDVNGTYIVLVDDVLSSGRTVRAALDEIMDYGRPARIQLACLVDRGLRELPIRADYLGKAIATQKGDHVSVRLDEMDGEDVVLLESGGEA
jgi:pyrimidine operon attenuation protein/uracil phosphoribosyltransferase